ncbi:hypothetical protein [Crocosphaera sp. Alani8]|uniref:hypothetical protein n=1 Tax=Crocosphaera sp. Alani8 TaxID=3038952 RepID=UPI00313E7ACD
MTAKFCLLIPAKILQIEKRFPEKLKIWTTEYKKSELIEFGFSDYHLLKLSEFVQQSDVNSDLPKEIYDRYCVIDWGFCFPHPDIIKDILTYLAHIYIYGEVGLLKYWSDSLKRFPAIKISNAEHNFDDFLAYNLPLDEIFFFPLKQFHETD